MINLQTPKSVCRIRWQIKGCKFNCYAAYGRENRNVGESKQQNITTSAQIYFSQTNIKSFICTLQQFYLK